MSIIKKVSWKQTLGESGKNKATIISLFISDYDFRVTLSKNYY